MTLGEQIKAWRTEHGVSQAALAKQAKVRQGTLSDWEADKGAPHIEKVAALARAMGVTVDSLLASVASDVEPIATAEEAKAAS